MSRDNWARLQASNSFKPDEIDIMRSMFAAYRRGGDIAAYMRNPAMLRVAAKFTKMAARIEVIKSQRVGKKKPTRDEELEALAVED